MTPTNADETSPSSRARQRLGASPSIRRAGQAPDTEETVLQPMAGTTAGDTTAGEDTVLRPVSPLPDGAIPAATPPGGSGSSSIPPGGELPAWLRDPVVPVAPQPERFMPPSEPPAPSRRHAPRALGGVLALAVVGGALLWHPWARQPSVDPNTVVTPRGTAAAPPPAHGRGDDVVRDYLTSLARGDVAHAISLGVDQGRGAHDLVDPSVYAAAREQAPISHVQVPRQPEDATTIPASFTVGSREVETTFHVHRGSDLVWRLDRSVASVIFGQTPVPIVVAGHTVRPGRSYDVLPGSYAVTTNQSGLVWNPAEFVVDAPADDLVPALTAQLTPTGTSAVQKAVAQRVQACALTRDAAPENCPFGFAPNQPGDRLVDAHWQLEPESGPTPVTLDPNDPSVAVEQVRVDATLTAREVGPGAGKGADAGNGVTRDSHALWQVRVPLVGVDPDRLQPRFDTSQSVGGR